MHGIHTVVSLDCTVFTALTQSTDTLPLQAHLTAPAVVIEADWPY